MNFGLCAPAIRLYLNFNEMDLFSPFWCVILPVMRDCPCKIVSTTPVSRLTFSNWYTMSSAYTDSAMEMLDKMHSQKRQCFVKLAAMSHQKTANDGPMDSWWTTLLQRPPGYVTYQMSVINTKINDIINYANYFPVTHSEIVLRNIYYHFHVGYTTIRYQETTRQWPCRGVAFMYAC